VLDELVALRVLSRVIGMGFGLIVLYALHDWSNFMGIFTVNSLVAGAALVSGGLIGFLFGIPRTAQSERAIPNTHAASSNNAAVGEQTSHDAVRTPMLYQANTNLEQISDWLTKILVGVGLIEMDKIITGLQTVVHTLQPSIGSGPTAKGFLVAMLVYFPVCGFLFGYLWTRLFLARVMQKVDLATLRNEAEEKAIFQIAHTLSQTSSLESSQITARGSEERSSLALWVDDRPANNTTLKESFEGLFGIKFDLALSTEEALYKVKADKGRYRVILSDMSRPPDWRAGYTLLAGLQQAGVSAPFILYAAKGGAPENRAEAKQLGAFGMTNSPQELLQLIQRALNE
jgi:CheY-like chemotaxis protein